MTRVVRNIISQTGAGWTSALKDCLAKGKGDFLEMGEPIGSRRLNGWALFRDYSAGWSLRDKEIQGETMTILNFRVN